MEHDNLPCPVPPMEIPDLIGCSVAADLAFVLQDALSARA
jgi:hypothetical protein